MGNFNSAVTDSGRQILSAVQAGAVFTPTRIVMGSGSLPTGTTIRNIKSLVALVKTLEINKVVASNDGTAIIGGLYSNSDVSTTFYFRELGLYAKAVHADGTESAEVLYAYGNSGTTADQMPAYTSGQPVERQLDIVTYVGNDTTINVSIASNTYVTQEQLTAALQSIDMAITDTVTGLKYKWGVENGIPYLEGV